MTNIDNLTLAQAINSIQPSAKFILTNGNFDSIEWLSPEIQIPTYEQVMAEVPNVQNAQALIQCKTQAKQKISETDWSVLPDVNISNKADFEVYRATLRDLIVNPVADPVWPTEPQPVWV